MKITRNDLILYTLAALATWMPTLPLLEQVFSYAAGRALAITVILYAHSQYGTKIALLLVLLYMRYASVTSASSFWEHLTMPPGDCTCKAGQMFDRDTRMCKSADGTFSPPASCQCPSGYEYDTQSGECKERPPVESVPVSHVPMTTPGEAQALATAPRPVISSAGPGPTPMERGQPTTAPVS